MVQDLVAISRRSDQAEASAIRRDLREAQSAVPAQRSFLAETARRCPLRTSETTAPPDGMRSSFTLARPIGPHEAALVAVRVADTVTWLGLVAIFGSRLDTSPESRRSPRRCSARAAGWRSCSSAAASESRFCPRSRDRGARGAFRRHVRAGDLKLRVPLRLVIHPFYSRRRAGRPGALTPLRGTFLRIRRKNPCVSSLSSFSPA